MSRAPKQAPPADGEAPDPDLTVLCQTRVSQQAHDMIAVRARHACLKPATWVRLELYKALGLLREGEQS
jgi:hypothetical protein